MNELGTQIKYVDSGTPGDGTEGLVIANNIPVFDNGVGCEFCSLDDGRLAGEISELKIGTNIVVHKDIEKAPCSKHLQVKLG